jgi:glucose-1-phosphate adenylyltransferase
MIRMHRERQADITLGLHTVSPHESYRYGIVEVDEDGRVDKFVEKPNRPIRQGFRDVPLASMGIYVFRKDFLIKALSESRDADFGRELLPRLIGKVQTYAYTFPGYWADVGTVQAYYEANTALLVETPVLDLYDPEWIIHTTSAQLPGVQLGDQARIENSMVSDGCRVYGYVTRSVLSPGVFVAPGATVRDSVILSDVWIGPGAVIERCIIDENARIGDEALVGDGDDNTPNASAPARLNTGLTLVGSRAQVPAGTKVGRNVVIRPRTTEAAFGLDRVIPSGTTLCS